MNDEDFLRSAGERMEGYFPGLSKRIDKLNSEQLGRGIVISNYQTDSSTPPRTELVGYVLPTGNDQREHVIIFKSGDIFVTLPTKAIPNSQTPQEAYDTRYILKLNPTLNPIEFDARGTYSNVEKMVGNPNLMRMEFWADVEMRNSSSESIPRIMAKVDQAITVAQEAKAERDRAKKESAQQFITRIDELLNPKKPMPPEEPTLPQ